MSLRRRLLRWAWRLSILVMLLLIGLTLPLRWIDPATSAFMVAEAWRMDQQPRREWVPFDEIADSLKLAVIASEDQKFPHHFGFDIEQIREAIDTRLEGGRLRGASTITQQLARNLYLWSGRSWIRKGLESALTVALEFFVPKARLLEIYLNVAEFDRGVFGAEAAARHYFAKSALALSAEEAALLAAVLPAPKRFDAARPDAFLRERQAWIIEQMGQLGSEWIPAR